MSYTAAVVLEYTADALAEVYARVKAIRLREDVVVSKALSLLREEVCRRMITEWREDLLNNSPKTCARVVEDVLPHLEKCIDHS